MNNDGWYYNSVKKKAMCLALRSIEKQISNIKIDKGFPFKDHMVQQNNKPNSFSYVSFPIVNFPGEYGVVKTHRYKKGG